MASVHLLGGSEVTAGAQVGRRAEGCVVDIEQSAVPSPFPSRPTSCQVQEMNCMGKETT